MVGEVRVLVYLRATGEEDIHRAYHEVSKEMAAVPGMLGNELLRSATGPGAYIVLSRWENLAAFRTWEQGARHRDSTAALRPFQDASMTPPFAVLEVAAGY